MLKTTENKELEKAYEAVFTKVYPGQYSAIAYETETDYIFTPRPMDIDPEARYFSGVVLPAVNKKTGDIHEVSLLDFSIAQSKVHPLILSEK